MHGSVREGLENLLAAKPSNSASEAVGHLAGCAECAGEFSDMRSHAQLLKSWQAPAVVEPSGGFYARVMQRIEAGARRSIWWVFVYSPIGKRLVYTSLALALALGSYVVSAESFDGHLSEPTVTLQTHEDPPVVGDTDQRREAVLANFVSHTSFPE